MVIAPRRRIWLYVDHETEPEVLEVVMLGDLSDIAPAFAAIKGMAERWPGFANVAIISNGTACGVLRMALTNAARYDDPLAEGMAMLTGSTAQRELPIRIALHPSGSQRLGIVGTW